MTDPPGGGARVWVDLTRPLGPATPRWLGDPPVRRVTVSRLDPADPASFALSRLSLSTHAGTHVDAPAHVIPGGADAGDLDLGVLCGPARVLDVRGRGPWLRAADLDAAAGAIRVLLHTGGGSGLTPDAAMLLLALGVRLVGIDALSVEPGPHLPVHRLLLGATPPVLLLEGLDLEAVPAGDGYLVCLPLRLPGADGAPCRAVWEGPCPTRPG